MPIPTGPNSVGTRVVQLVDSPSRRDPYVANGTMRDLLVRRLQNGRIYLATRLELLL